MKDYKVVNVQKCGSDIIETDTILVAPTELDVKSLVRTFQNTNPKWFCSDREQSDNYLPVLYDVDDHMVGDKLIEFLLLNGCSTVKVTHVEIGD